MIWFEYIILLSIIAAWIFRKQIINKIK